MNVGYWSAFSGAWHGDKMEGAEGVEDYELYPADYKECGAALL